MHWKALMWMKNKQVSDPELLAEIMEIREAVEEVANPPALQQIQFQVKGKPGSLVQVL
ncbi:hypothetical protein Sjap_018348 [Stephania japonica]|uniref:Co-chaperone HscB C-terminal oligomerisation domain-containing protein n=1 Tax=Stephania japonica TaxID=461633 RepID=A0AAP0NKF4_9MAGN